ncbi:hypothetical protein AB1Y20_003414 [Prymnesium parvum]|uniref:adenosine deaminase n=1 Tax=Prymnesium parvum TaxID=97485 RepID=A0AB34JBS7_PRYPA
MPSSFSAPDDFIAEFYTSAGAFRVHARRAWSPHGVDRFYRLLQRGHYNDTRVYRVVPTWVAQFGYAGDPSRQQAYAAIPDDPPRVAQNVRGTLSFSASYTSTKDHATNRTTELFINLQDHFELDALGFTPIASILDDGMTVVEGFYHDYGEMSDACRLHGFVPCNGPAEERILSEGNAYLDREFPRLTRIYGAAVVNTRPPRSASLYAPRTELHCHLDGSIPVKTLLNVSQRRKLHLPGLPGVPSSEEDIWVALNSISPVWRKFDLVNDIIGGDEQILFEMGLEFAARQAASNILYTEVRYDPVRAAVSRLGNTSINVENAVQAIEAGLREGSTRHGVEVYQLLCAMRGAPAEACFALARLAAAMRSGRLGGVVGIDLAGDELHFNNSRDHVEECFRYAKLELELNTTVHAGEMAGPEDVRSAVNVMLADRVGHGYSAIQDEELVALLKQRGMHLEACPAGHHNNLNATGAYLRYGLNFGLSTDDPAPYFANTSMGAIESLVQTKVGFSAANVSHARRNAFEARFAPSAARLALHKQTRSVDTVVDGGFDAALSMAIVASVALAGVLSWWAFTKWKQAVMRAWRVHARKAMAAQQAF